ncbi:hypothetical protein SAMN02927900_05978 [Rhizobium mongolense subsp. loessense]|uniref:Uncharacterized protein n=1 Tax=Rhizobium mongolense subsp. loessense TaxID=158890 RepID=A0A1G4U210_9HYPH|nr:hypothetical protein SAMN02927900_05978 [Rhizobium mongolense subsp. loessense]
MTDVRRCLNFEDVWRRPFRKRSPGLRDENAGASCSKVFPVGFVATHKQTRSLRSQVASSRGMLKIFRDAVLVQRALRPSCPYLGSGTPSSTASATSRSGRQRLILRWNSAAIALFDKAPDVPMPQAQFRRAARLSPSWSSSPAMFSKVFALRIRRPCRPSGTRIPLPVSLVMVRETVSVVSPR